MKKSKTFRAQILILIAIISAVLVLHADVGLSLPSALSVSSSDSILLKSDDWLEFPLATPWLVTDTVLVDTIDPKRLSHVFSMTKAIRVLIVAKLPTKDVLLFSADDNYGFCDDRCYRRWQFLNAIPWLSSREVVGILTQSAMCHVQPIFPIPHIPIQQKDDASWDYDVLMFVMLGNPNENGMWHADSRLADLSVAVRSLLRYSTCRFRLHLVIQSEEHISIFETLFRHPDFITLTIILHVLTDKISYDLLPDELVRFTNPKLIHSLKKLILPFIMPTDIKSVLVLDTDIVVVDDLCPVLDELSSYSTMFAFAPDVNPSSVLPMSDKINIASLGVLHPQFPVSFTGINGGVILWNLDKTRQVNYDLVWKHAVASYVYEFAASNPFHQPKIILEFLFYAGEQYIFDQILRQHREWLTVLPIGMNFTLYVATRFQNDKYFCQISQNQLHLRILHGTGNVFKNHGRLLSEIVRTPFLDQVQFHGIHFSILGNASNVDLANLARAFLYHDICLSSR